jgi:Leucine-rich repeat (LRR) protein
MYNLVSLDLSNNKLKRFQKGLLANTLNIQFINLSANSLALLETGVFSGLNSLETLDVSRNAIHELHAFYDLPRLVNLYMHQNSFEKLRVLRGLQRLTNFYVSPELLQAFESVSSLIETVNASATNRFVKRNYANVVYLKSMNTLFVSFNESDSSLKKNERECFNVFFLIRHSIALNLRSDEDFAEFAEKCENYAARIFSDI